MSEMEKKSWSKIREELLQKIWDDPEFKKTFIENPKKILEKELGRKLPRDLKVNVYENTPAIFNIVLPQKSSGELSDDDLENVAGGVSEASFLEELEMEEMFEPKEEQGSGE